MANPTSDGSAFARDLGYLDKFFVNLDAHAATLAPAEGARLKKLIAEEVERWKEIRGLISGQPAAPSAAAKSPEPSPPQRSVAPAPPPAGPQRAAFTVGSLLGQPKK